MWWKFVDGGVEFFDAEVDTQLHKTPTPHHFRCTTMADVDTYLMSKWEQCINMKIKLPAFFIRTYTTNGESHSIIEYQPFLLLTPCPSSTQLNLPYRSLPAHQVAQLSFPSRSLPARQVAQLSIPSHSLPAQQVAQLRQLSLSSRSLPAHQVAHLSLTSRSLPAHQVAHLSFSSCALPAHQVAQFRQPSLPSHSRPVHLEEQPQFYHRRNSNCHQMLVLKVLLLNQCFLCFP